MINSSFPPLSASTSSFPLPWGGCIVFILHDEGFTYFTSSVACISERYPVIHRDEESETERQWLQRDLLLDLDG